MSDPLIIQVKILTANGCDLCRRAKEMLNLHTYPSHNGGRFVVDLVELNLDANPQDAWNTPALDYAIENDLDHVPSFKIGDRIFIEDLFTKENVKEALEAEYFRITGDTKIGS
jgi:glutaredoxin